MENPSESIFINRELSWLDFDSRVLALAKEKSVPLAERIKFAAIFGSNMDEFFMVRVGSLYDQTLLKNNKLDIVTHMTPSEQIAAITPRVAELQAKCDKYYQHLLSALKENKYIKVDFDHLDKQQEHYWKAYFTSEILPILSPQVVDQRHPFPFLRNKEIYYAAQLNSKNDGVYYGIIPLSGQFEQLLFIKNPDGTTSFAFADELIDSNPAFSYPLARPIQAPADYDLYAEAHKHDVLLSYPYQSIRPFIRMLMKAGSDPDVVSIKMTLYRMASDSQIVQALINAAENGKEVTAMVELRARFDEQNNIDWSKQLEEAGCTVFYGFDDYKVHSKLTLITSKVNGKYHYLTQIGTGNYNEKTSELYTDLSFITTRQEIGEEASAVFNNMALQRLTSEADTMLVAPLRFKSVLLEQMDRQIDRARRGLPASMILKNNSINDPQIINKISEASCAGVRVDMIVRGICCIKAGVPGKTENVHIRSIVGRYLEHSRIYCFGEGEDMTIYIASGDFLTRNTERRVEVGVRVDDREIAKKLRGILDLQLRDTVNAREMQPDGIYTRVKPKQGEPPVDSQMAMYGYFQHGFETAHPAAPTRKAAAKPVQKPKRPMPHPHKPENKRFRGFLDSLFGHKK